MSISLYDVSIPTFRRGLQNLASFLDKAEAHAKGSGADLAAYTAARLAPDMHPFTRQVQIASDSAKSAAAQLAGVTAPEMADTETTFPELKARIAKTVAFLDTIKKADVDARDAATIELPTPNGPMTFSAPDFLMTVSIPNFFFHVTTAYGLLRAKGVPLGKMDFLAGAQFAAAA
ncbi:MAG TPA: DUF1993 domain-containing protein [Caulobacteraceae bacterium]|nr:DUF1993 domain-containing protein [Caulobacteraceae bacterium]